MITFGKSYEHNGWRFMPVHEGETHVGDIFTKNHRHWYIGINLAHRLNIPYHGRPPFKTQKECKEQVEALFRKRTSAA